MLPVPVEVLAILPRQRLELPDRFDAEQAAETATKERDVLVNEALFILVAALGLVLLFLWARENVAVGP